MAATSPRTESASPGASQQAYTETRLAKSCARCRQHKLACKSGSRGRYPCAKCELIDAQCILVESARAVPGPTLSERLAQQERATASLTEAITQVRNEMANTVQLFKTKSQALLGTTTNDQEESAARIANDNSHASSALGPLPFEAGEASAVIPFEHADEGDVTASRAMTDSRRYRAPIEEDHIPSPKRKRGPERSSAVLEHAVAFGSFMSQNLSALFFFDPRDFPTNPRDAQAASELLFWAIVAVGSRERDDLHDFHLSALAETMRLLGATLCGRRVRFWDLVGAMIYNRYLTSITPIGHLVDLAYSLDLDSAYDVVLRRGHPTVDDARKIRLWVSIVGQDIFHSCVCNRMPHYPQTDYALAQAQWLTSCPFAVPNDQRLLATYEFEKIIRSVLVVEHPADTETLNVSKWERITREKCSEIDRWYSQWEPIARKQSRPGEISSMLSAVEVNANLAKFTIAIGPLRGVKISSDLNASNKGFLLEAVRRARALCRVCVSEFPGPAIKFVGETTLFAFAWSANFILKVLSSLEILPEVETMLGEVEEVIGNLKLLSHATYAQVLQDSLEYVRFIVQLGAPNATDPSPLPEGTSDRRDIASLPSLGLINSELPGSEYPLSDLQSMLASPSRLDPTTAWWLPMDQGGDDWPWARS